MDRATALKYMGDDAASASVDQLHKIYRKRTLLYHPDITKDDGTQFKLLTASYEFLKAPIAPPKPKQSHQNSSKSSSYGPATKPPGKPEILYVTIYDFHAKIGLPTSINGDYFSLNITHELPNTKIQFKLHITVGTRLPSIQNVSIDGTPYVYRLMFVATNNDKPAKPKPTTNHSPDFDELNGQLKELREALDRRNQREQQKSEVQTDYLPKAVLFGLVVMVIIFCLATMMA